MGMARQGIFAWLGSVKWVEKAWLNIWYFVAGNYTRVVTVHYQTSFFDHKPTVFFKTNIF